MDLSATYVFSAPVERVWDLLMDTNAVGSCLPGCKGLQPIGDDRYEVELGVAVAAIAGSFKGMVSLEEKVPPQSYRLMVEGTGRQGFVKGHAGVALEADGDRTRVHVAAHAEVGRTIARVGQRLLEGVARTTMDRSTPAWPSRWRWSPRRSTKNVFAAAPLTFAGKRSGMM